MLRFLEYYIFYILFILFLSVSIRVNFVRNTRRRFTSRSYVHLAERTFRQDTSRSSRIRSCIRRDGGGGDGGGAGVERAERSLIVRPSLRLQCRRIRCTFSPAAGERADGRPRPPLHRRAGERPCAVAVVRRPMHRV